MHRMTNRLVGPAAALWAAGVATTAAAAGPADDCPSHGVLLDAAALCEAPLPPQQLVDAERGRDATARNPTGLFAVLRAMAPRASAPADGRPPLAVTAEPDAPVVRAALRQHAARDEGGR